MAILSEIEALRIALLSYRGNPHCGGQGVYVRQLGRALRALGHKVEVFSGQPYPELDPGLPLTELPSLDLYRDEDPFRPSRALKDPIDVLEFAVMCAARFPEPLAFSLRAWRALAKRRDEFDVVHDNQCLGYGLLGLQRSLPLVATVHHPIAVDLRLELAGAEPRRHRSLKRWYGFIRMQERVARRLSRILTVSTTSKQEIVEEMSVAPERIAVVPNGVDSETFRPLPEVPRMPGRVVTVASADVPLKGLVPLMEAIARVRARRAVDMVVVGRARPNGSVQGAIQRLGLEGVVRFVTGLAEEQLVQLYAGAELAVVPSLYEGFSFPAVEAMACGVPLVATATGALPDVIGSRDPGGLLVPGGDSEALAAAIGRALDDGALRTRLGANGRRRATEEFSWRRAAELTADQYREAMAAC